MTLPDRAAALDTLYQRDCAHLDRDTPWSATFSLQLPTRVVTYRISPRRTLDATDRNAAIISFAHPLAAAYYEHRPGEEFELDDPRFAEIHGLVTERTVATPDGRRLAAIEITRATESGRCIRDGDAFQLETPTPVATRSTRGLPDIRALLTPEQYRLITSDRRRPLIIQGRAGSGKTTVALYRLAYLTAPEAEPSGAALDPKRVLIVMFNRALQTFVARSLEDVELGAAAIDTFHGWALDRVKRAYRGDLQILADPTNQPERQATVTAIKKRLGILAAIDAFVVQQERRMLEWLEASLRPYRGHSWLERYHASTGPVVRRLVALRTQARTQRDAAIGAEARRRTEIHKVFVAAVAKMTQYKDELLRLFTDTSALRAHLPDVPVAELEILAEYQRELQRKDASERRAGPWIHFDDLAPLIKLIVLKHGGLPDTSRDEEIDVYDHLMIDEAQDFGAVELDVLLSVVRSRTGVTVVGDVNQKIVPAADFIGWDALARELGLEGSAVARLEVAHRSTAPIMALANTLTGDGDAGGRPGPRPRLVRTAADDGHAALVRELDRLGREFSSGHVAVVTRTRTSARSLADALAAELHPRGVAVRHGHNQSFAFEPGITVTNMAQIKGLEFDAVVVVEPTEASYPASDADSRRRLYTVLTRAKSELVLLTSEPPTSLLAPAIERGLLEVVEADEVPAFDAADDDPF